jgi:hypothetical protein
MLDRKIIDAIANLAAHSAIARYMWNNRGPAPVGYIKGLAATYGLMLQKLMAGAPEALAMVRVVNDGIDVFDHYQTQLHAAGLITVGATAVERMRALFVILLGLGMRESSGGWDIGQDASAPENRTEERAEAGCWQQSWDSRSASRFIPMLLHANEPTRIDPLFFEQVHPRPGAWKNYGDPNSNGVLFQYDCKHFPSFAAQCAALCLRTDCEHFGPINTHKAECRPEAVELFKQVEALVLPATEAMA